MNEPEGVIKYRLDYRPGPLPPGAGVAALQRWFHHCRARGLIGRDPGRYGGLAYGNLSQRLGRGFLVSGTQTGGRGALGPGDLAWVTGYDLAANWLRAEGPARPSSEALTHALVYHTRPEADGVIHVHSPEIWRQARLLGLAATPAHAAYGTPALAAAVAALLARSPAHSPGVLVMAGHEDGVLAWGADLDRAGARLLQVLAAAATRSPPRHRAGKGNGNGAGQATGRFEG